MIRPRINPRDAPFVRALQRHLERSASNALAFVSPIRAVVYFQRRQQAVDFEQGLNQVASDHRKEKPEEKMKVTKDPDLTRQLREVNWRTHPDGYPTHVIHFSRYYGEETPGEGDETLNEKGPYAVHLEFTHPGIGYKVWQKLVGSKESIESNRALFPGSEIFDERREQLLPKSENLNSLARAHRQRYEIKKRILEHLLENESRILENRPSPAARDFLKRTAEYNKGRKRFLLKNSLFQVANAAVLAFFTKGLGPALTFMNQYLLGGWSVWEGRKIGQKGKGLQPEGNEHVMAEIQIGQLLSSRGPLGSEKAATRREHFQNILRILKDHLNAHELFIRKLRRNARRTRRAERRT